MALLDDATVSSPRHPLQDAVGVLQAVAVECAGSTSLTGLSTLSRAELAELVGRAQQVLNAVHGLQTVVIAHLAAIDERRNPRTQEWTESFRGLGRVSDDAAEVVATRLGCSTDAAGRRVTDAVHQVSATPALVRAMLAGDVDGWRARVATSELARCDDDDALVVSERLVEHYRKRGWWDEPPGPLRTRARALVARQAPDALARAAAKASDDRYVSRRPDVLGCDQWQASLSVEQSLVAWHAIETRAVALRSASKGSLTLSQARADAFVELILQRADVTVHLHATSPYRPDDQGSSAVSGPGPGDCPPQGSPGTPPASDTGVSRETVDLAPEVGTGGPRGAPPTTDGGSARPADPTTDGGSARPAPPTTDGRSARPADPTTDGGSARHAPPTTDGGAARPADPCSAAHPATESHRRHAVVRSPGSDPPALSDSAGPCRVVVAGVPIWLDLRLMHSHTRVVSSTELGCHPGTGAIVAGAVPVSLAPVSTKDARRVSDRYVVPADVARMVRLRDGHCRFPGCTRSARFCDLDHVVPWPAGPTTHTNLVTLCRHHHRVKHERRWRVTLHPGAALTWVDPTGRVVRTDPYDHRGQPAVTTPSVRSADDHDADDHRHLTDHAHPEPKSGRGTRGELTFSRHHRQRSALRDRWAAEADTHRAPTLLELSIERRARLHRAPTRLRGVCPDHCEPRRTIKVERLNPPHDHTGPTPPY